MQGESELEAVRLKKLEVLRQGGMEAWPRVSARTHTTAEAIKAFEQAEQAEPVAGAADAQKPDVLVTVVGRIRSIREMGKSIFAHIEDGSGKLQVYLRSNDVGAEAFALFRAGFDLGDFLEATGKMFRTKMGEVSVHVTTFKMSAKALSPLPASKEEVVDGKKVVYSSFSNPEARYRERYADLAVNSDVREIFRARAKVVTALRNFLDSKDFLEVETPILQPIYGGAAAKPFTTHHNQLHQDLYLRISFELYLKRLLVGGLERVYEIGRDFRNEGISFKHNPEFTQLEFYMAYADYNDVMALTENMLCAVAKAVLGTTTFQYQGHTLCLDPPWKRISLFEAIAETSGVYPGQHKTAESLKAAMQAKGHRFDPEASWPRLVDHLFGAFVEPNLIQPTFVLDYPREMTPLAKGKPDNPDIVERFEGFIGGMELCNAFTELNDPIEQELRFAELGRSLSAEDEANHPMDIDYLRAMRYGMPPNGGFGMGIDRLTMLMTDRATIREVLLFPHLRAKEES